MKPSSRIVTLLFTLCLVCACTVSRTTEIASRSVEVFHQQFSESRFSEIYAAATPGFRTSHTEAGILTSLSVARTRLGSLRTVRRTGWVIDRGEGGEIARLNFESDFENGTATERFTYLVANGRAQLLDYQISSPLIAAD